MDIKEVILVDEQDRVIGKEEKILAHRQGLLHRAFSVFIFKGNGEMLLQQRSLTKYHSDGLWTNACCSHPSPGEGTQEAAMRRLKEELGIEVPVSKIFDFIYKATFENGLTENEFDHVFAGVYEGLLKPDSNEVMNICFKTMAEIKLELQKYPGLFTEWFRLSFDKIEKWWNKQFDHLQID